MTIRRTVSFTRMSDGTIEDYHIIDENNVLTAAELPDRILEHHDKALSEAARNSRDALREHPHYELAVDFCARWDQISCDPDYETRPLQHFEPLVRRVFTRAPFADHRWQELSA